MSSFGPDFEHFRTASGYRNRSTDHQSKFDAFRRFVMDGRKSPADSSFVIQFVCHPNFEAYAKTVTYFQSDDEGGFHKSSHLPNGFKRANSYQNYKSTSGHPKGLFYELNLYTGDGHSNHHTIRVTGSNYTRDNAHDLKAGNTKGPHWLE